MKVKVVHHTPRVYEVYNDDESICYGVVGTVGNLIYYDYLVDSSVDYRLFYFLPNTYNDLTMLELSCFAEDFTSALSYVREYDRNMKNKIEQEENMFKQYKIRPNLQGPGWFVYKLNIKEYEGGMSKSSRVVYQTDNYMDALFYVYNKTKK